VEKARIPSDPLIISDFLMPLQNFELAQSRIGKMPWYDDYNQIDYKLFQTGPQRSYRTSC
jgi:hypothetical protein